MSFLESFENVNQERRDEILNPTNDPVNASLGYWNLQRRHNPICSSVFLHNEKWPNSITFQNIYRILIPLNLSNFTQRYQLLRNGWPSWSASQYSRCCTNSPWWGTWQFLFIFLNILWRLNWLINESSLQQISSWNTKLCFRNQNFRTNLKQLNLSLKEYYEERLVLPCHLIHLSFPWAIYNYLSRGTEDDSWKWA